MFSRPLVAEQFATVLQVGKTHEFSDQPRFGPAELLPLSDGVFKSEQLVSANPAYSARGPFTPGVKKRCAMVGSRKTATGIVALFNASDDTIDMVQKLLTASGDDQTLIWCHFADLKKGIVDFRKYMDKHNPEVVIFDLSPPYDENWHFFKTMRDSMSMRGRGSVLTTTNKMRLDEVLGEDSFALEVVGQTADMAQIQLAIKAETAKASASRLVLA